ncbi:fibronectin type III domain protein [Streptomyces laurentii]|uniref:Fibronectin type III domain protein n=1 Tax=Streptomyces laurentii TaxID=39478 RepID=A0A160P520_STRLU|nr:fibronectin type III domain protein [Streptomyces laurentii]
MPGLRLRLRCRIRGLLRGRIWGEEAVRHRLPVQGEEDSGTVYGIVVQGKAAREAETRHVWKRAQDSFKVPPVFLGS